VAPPNGGTAIFNAVGGVEWPLLGAAARAEVIAALQQASWVSVRDRVTQAHLRSGGITAPLCPDPAVMVRACFDDRIGQHRRQGEVADVIRAAPQGHIACQFSADFGDDHTLDQLARGLRGVCARTGLGLVLFRAGAAPWHDQLDPYERLRQRLPAGQAHVFRSLHLWDICALIASARAYCGSSLHGAVVAMAHGLSHVSLLAPQSAGRRGKVAAYLETWEPESVAMCVKVEEVERALIEALAQSAVRREQRATELVQQYQASQLRWMAGLT
jgi:polysaccharide pyruvyl transferase WcaK-like protein